MKVCTNCGGRNDDEASFCGACNYFLEWSNNPSEPGGRLPNEPSAAATRDSAQAALSATRPNRRSERPTAEPANTEDLPVDEHLIDAALDGLQHGRELAIARDRSDLARTLDRSRANLDDRTIGIAVVGEFKQGKSTLINALLQAAVCPVDADEVTVVPTLVRYGKKPSATAYLDHGDPSAPSIPDPAEPVTHSVPPEHIASYVSEAGNPGNRRGLRSVEVRLPHKMLHTGLCLIDTPGVGGLDSAHGVITLGALDSAVGMLFVTDASQELTRPELDFLRQAVERCPAAACVVTKTDLHRHWRRVVALNRQHLAEAELTIPVIAVSSFLRLASRQNPSLTNDSGYPALVDFLAAVVTGANETAVAVAASDVGFVADHIGVQIRAEEAVLTDPERAERVISQLAKAQDRTAEVASSTATWQQVLSDGVQDLVADVEHDLQGRLRTVLRDVEGVIDACDPADAWADIEVWLRRHVVAAAVQNYDTLAERTRELAADVSTRFQLDAGDAVVLSSGSPPESLGLVNLASVRSLATPGGRFAPMLMATRTAMFVPMVLFGVAGGLLGVAIAAPLTALLAAGIGQKVIRDEKKRQISYRRQQAKAAARRYVDEVGFIMNKETRDALRRTQRQLRDDFQIRARTLHRSSTNAVKAARHAMTLSGPVREQRVAQLAAEAEQLKKVNGRVAQLISHVPSTGVA